MLSDVEPIVPVRMVSSSKVTNRHWCALFLCWSSAKHCCHQQVVELTGYTQPNFNRSTTFPIRSDQWSHMMDVQWHMFLCDHTKYGSHIAIVKSVVCRLSVCHACELWENGAQHRPIVTSGTNRKPAPPPISQRPPLLLTSDDLEGSRPMSLVTTMLKTCELWPNGGL